MNLQDMAAALKRSEKSACISMPFQHECGSRLALAGRNLRSKEFGCQLTTGKVPFNLKAGGMKRSRHPKKEVEEAIRYAEDHGWRVEVGGSHAWGRMYCPYNDSECRCGEFCITSIWSTPRNVVNHARQLKRVVDNCTTRKRDAMSVRDEE